MYQVPLEESDTVREGSTSVAAGLCVGLRSGVCGVARKMLGRHQLLITKIIKLKAMSKKIHRNMNLLIISIGILE